MTGIYTTRLNLQRKEIRVLRLGAGSPGDSLEITLHTVSLFENPRYHALSYVWGDPSRSRNILSNGCKFGITKNLELALQHLRSHMDTSVETLPLWIDAICINQSDLTERNEQVGMMDRIFSQACRVLLWLGEGDGFSDELFDYLGDPSFLKSLQEARRVQGRGPNEHEIRANAIFDNNIDERPWWGRIWVLQEFVLAHQDPVVLCGTKACSWETMFQCRRLLSSPIGDLHGQPWVPPEERPEIPSLPFNSVMSHHWHWAGLREDYQHNGPLSLHDALLAIRDARATDKRDYIYGLLGLMKREDTGKVMIDYSQPPMFIYKGVMEYVWTCGHVDLLSEVIPRLGFARSSDSEGWPSWVPDLSEQKLDAGTAFLLGSSTRSSDFCSFPTTPQVSLSEDKCALLLAGVELDTICDVLDLTALDEIDLETLDCIDNLLVCGRERQQLTNSGLEYSVRISRLPDSLACFVSGWTHEEIRPIIEVGDNETDRPPGECLGRDEDANPSTEAICRCWPYIPTSHPFRADTEGRLCGRKVFLTSQGFPGIGTPDVKEGDLVVRPFGADCQYVLRSRSDRMDYTLQGFAYLSGFMDPGDLDRLYSEGALMARVFAIF